MTQLLLPDRRRYDEWWALVDELVASEGEPAPAGSGLWAAGDRTGRDRFAFWLENSERYASSATLLPEGRVPATQWVIADDDGVYVGFLQMRHELNDFLLDVGGHIGYSVRPTRRREGHASRALGLAVRRAADLGLDRVLVTCDDDNLASARTIESQGGVLEDVRDVKRRYWIAV